MTDRKEPEKLFPPIKHERGIGASDERLAYMVEFQKWLIKGGYTVRRGRTPVKGGKAIEYVEFSAEGEHEPGTASL